MFCAYEMIKCDTVLSYVDAIKGPTVCNPDLVLTLYRHVANHSKKNTKWLSKVLVHWKQSEQFTRVSELYWRDEHNSYKRHFVLWQWIVFYNILVQNHSELWV